MSVNQRANGQWYCRFQLNGVRVHRLCHGATTKKEAEIIEAEFKFKLIQQQNGAMPSEEKTTTLKKLVDIFLTFSELNKKSYKQDTYRSKVILEYFKPNTKINTIKSVEIEKFKSFLLTDKRGKITANRYIENLSKMFNIAIDNEWLRKNPINKDTKFKKKNYGVRYLHDDEEIELFKHLSGYMRDMVIVALNTGLRRANILNLKWSEISFEFNMLEILENKTNEHIKLPMNNVLIDLFKRLAKERTSEYVFVNPKTNRPYVDIRKTWNKAKKDAGIEDLRFHDLRHTVCTRLIKKGVPLPVVQKIMFHKSIQTTMRYSHVDSIDMERAMTLLGSNANMVTPI